LKTVWFVSSLGACSTHQKEKETMPIQLEKKQSQKEKQKWTLEFSIVSQRQQNSGPSVRAEQRREKTNSFIVMY
jgi:hypothetical protein